MNEKPAPRARCPRCGNHPDSSMHLIRRCAEADAHEAAVRAGRGTCSVCEREVRVLKNGTIGPHNVAARPVTSNLRFTNPRCGGWGKKPKGSAP